MMWEAARDKILAKGGHILMGQAMKQLAADGQGGWRLSATGADGGETLIRARHAISRPRCASWRRGCTRCRRPRSRPTS
jgi:hypothetical protein